MNTEIFVNRLKDLYGNAYDYSCVEYVKSNVKVDIICKKHGKFSVRPNDILRGHGCPKCGKERLKEKLSFTADDFIKKAKDIHGDKYDYSKVEYVNSETKVCIICPEHGEFWQTPHSHISGKGCPQCGLNTRVTKRSHDKNIFIDKAVLAHGKKYDYSSVEYKNTMEKVCIICPEHGKFWQRPVDHLHGHGCPKCGKTSKLFLDDFIKKSNAVHGNFYDYSEVVYKNNREKVCIICPKHGKFWQTPSHHMSGHGCPKCFNSRLENDIIELLNNNNIKYEYNQRYKFLENLQLDFYLPELKVGIECQGIQHFKPVDGWGGLKQFEKNIANDKKKKYLCEENGIKLYYYSDLDVDYPYDVIRNQDELLKLIQNGTID